MARVCYDVVVSSIVPSELFRVKSLASNWEYLTSLKIDCLIDGFTNYRIVEIKPVFDMKAIGQVFVYASLLATCYVVDKPIIMSILTNSASDNIIDTCRQLGISIYVRDRNYTV